MLSLEMDQTDIEHARERVMEQGHGREAAICELRCLNCGDGLRFDQRDCITCGETNPRFDETFDSRRPVAVKSIP